MKEWKEFLTGYSVSSEGEVRNDLKGTFRKPQKRRKNAEYLSVSIQGKNFDIHRLVAEKFVANPENLPEVRHLNGKASDNRAVNLKWGTHRENIRDAMEHGTHTSLTSETFKAQQNEELKPSKVNRKAKSGVPGIMVYEGKRGKKYRVYLNTQTLGSTYIGTYGTMEEAQEIHRNEYFKLYGVYP